MTNTATTFYGNRHFSATNQGKSSLAEKLAKYFRSNAGSILYSLSAFNGSIYGFARYNMPQSITK